MEKYNPQEIESKWQKIWEEQKLFKTPEDINSENKFYILPQLPYPSGSGLHVGHAEVYTACDIYARYQRMTGKKVLQVIGWDSFGLPAENYAIKTNVHPAKSTETAVNNFRSQIKSLGISVDWDREVGSHNPDYYKWTQWFFLLFYKRGLAYRKKQSVNWCDSCKTVLANDQVKEGHCERCDTLIIQKEMEQWYIKITDYAERLLNDIDKLDWPEETKKRQKDWIGKSEGAEVDFRLQTSDHNQEKKITVFTTRPDTLFGATYMVLAPEHAVVRSLKSEVQNWDEVEKYIEATSKKTELDRQVQKEKTGVELKGIKAINPVKNEEIPIFVADYVLATYGTGAIMAVPAHDERDFEFAKKYNLPIKDVVVQHCGGFDKSAKHRDSAAAVVFKDDKVLVLFNKKFNIYRLPSGGMERGETVEDTVQRELREEAGYTDYEVVDDLGMIESNFYAVDKNIQWNKLQRVLKLKLLSDKKTDTAFESYEDYEANWLAPDEAIEKLKTYNGSEEIFIRRALEKTGRLFSGEGTAINSNFLDGLSTQEAKEKMIQWLEEKGIGKRKVQYKLRDWSVSRQRFWGAPIPMLFNEERKNRKYNYVFIHGYLATGNNDFRPWLKKELEQLGHAVFSPDLPHNDKPNVVEWAEYILNNTTIDENTVIVAHSLGGPVAFRILEKLKNKIAKLILVDTVLRPDFPDKKRPDVEASDSFEFDFEKIKSSSDEFVVIADCDYKTIKKEHLEEMQKLLDARLVKARPNDRHFNGKIEPSVLEESIVTGLKPVSESDLPVLLPDDVDFKPTGQSPLTYSEDFQKGVEKRYGKGWHREPDTLDTFMCSSWYYYRYLDPKNDQQFASPEALKKWMPVDFYLGGPEHVNGHLLYSRFFTKVLYDAGYIDFSAQGGSDLVGDEPFKVHRHQGLILGPDNRKMSKRWGNVINPTDVVNEFGADTMRMYEMFMGPLEQDKPWDTNGVRGLRRFLDRVWALQQKIKKTKNQENKTDNNKL